jgi:hypothetical protein
MIQDGYERWTEPTREKAIHSMIQAARVLNGSYIHADDIAIGRQMPVSKKDQYISEEEYQLIQDIRSGRKKVLPFDHWSLKYRVTKDEVQTLIQIREGELKVVQGG